MALPKINSSLYYEGNSHPLLYNFTDKSSAPTCGPLLENTVFVGDTPISLQGYTGSNLSVKKETGIIIIGHRAGN